MADHAVRLNGVSKCYKLYDANRNRLKEVLHPFGKKYHRQFYALKNLDLEIRKGEILGVLGRNGSGKSTLLKIVSGIISTNEGSVTVNGRISALLELGTGFNPEFTGRENISFYGVVNGYGKEFMQSKIGEIIEFADIGEFIDQPLKSYSSGMKTRLGFAVAIHVSPDILILDEVLAVGDELFRRKCYAKMEEFLNRGTTILFVSHDLQSMIQMCTRAIFLDEGCLLAEGEPREICNIYQRVLYASPENRKILIKQLKEEGLSKSLAAGRNNGETAVKDKSRPQSSPEYMEELKPLSGFEYRNEHIDIVDAHFQSAGGQRVNILNFGNSYWYSVKYHSKSEQTFKQITFGFAIKDSKGTILTAIDARRSLQRKIFAEELRPGQTLELKVKFDCKLPSGTYFVNSGLSSFESGEQSVLNRKIDSACFKVQDSPCRVFSGLFSCMKTMSIQSQDGEQSFNLESQ